jgi:hypothetical protein
LNPFLNSSAAIAASLSATSVRCLIFRHAVVKGWRLHVSPWGLREVRDNLADKPPESVKTWLSLRRNVVLEEDELICDWPIVFEAAKDKPVLFSALACADELLTLDRRDFRDLLRKTIYGMPVLTPADFLRSEREAERLFVEL